VLENQKEAIRQDETEDLANTPLLDFTPESRDRFMQESPSARHDLSRPGVLSSITR
jgi:hypothetical protein